MNCPSKNRDFEVRPKDTKTHSYIWKEVENNPNLYCWVPIEKIAYFTADDVNIQDIPPAPPLNDDILAQIAEEAEYTKQKKLLKIIENGKSPDQILVSVDDPRKYSIVKDFIKNKGLKLYGGSAINYYLPKEAKIYSSTDIPDYDFYSTDPWNDAVELADIFYKKGYKYVEAKAGIHKGTYKVFVNLWPVADISYIPKKEFDALQTRTISELKIISPFALLRNIYKEFSEPFANPGRWPKVANREKLFVKWTHPLDGKFKCGKDLFMGGKIKIDDTVAKLLEVCSIIIKKNNYAIAGSLAYNTYIEIGGGYKRLVVDHYTILVENGQQVVQDIFEVLIKTYKELEIITIFTPARELNNTTYCIYVVLNNNYFKICEIINCAVCTPINKILGRTVIAIDYLKYILYDDITTQDSEDAKCKLQYLEKIQLMYYENNNISEMDPSPFQRFIINCIGPTQNNLKVAILDRILDKVNSNIIKEYTDTHRIIKIPKKEIPKECLGLDKEICKYPCSWNKYVGKCQGLPNGTYRPDLKDLDPF